MKRRRETCPCCGRSISVTACDGRFVHHNSGPGAVCDGGHRIAPNFETWAEYVARTDRTAR